MGRFLVVISVVLAMAAQACTVETAAVQDAPAPPPPPIQNLSQRYFFNLDSVVYLDCGDMVGTGEIIGQNRIMTAAHVVGKAEACRIGILQAVVVENNADLDYAILEVPTGMVRRPVRLSCAGFVSGQTYYAIGYAHGRDFAITRLTATSRFDENGKDSEFGTLFTHTRILDGEVYRGMSGGPIVNQDGVVVGITSATIVGIRPQALSRELKNTTICSSDK